MKRTLLAFLLILFTSSCNILLAQALVFTDTITTLSKCVNDGSISVNAANGAPIYHYTLLSGPPPQTYPFTLAPGLSVFQTLASGHYRLMVTDAAHDTAYATATVPGNYQYPTMTNSIFGNCIKSTPFFGRPPLTYALSTVSQSTGFGTYQSSPNFCGLCDGSYWVRIKDSCGNIFTSNKINLFVPSPSLFTTCRTDTVVAGVSVQTGAPPFTYTLSSGSFSVTNQNGVLPTPHRSCIPNTIKVTDFCNKKDSIVVNCHPLHTDFIANCDSGDVIIFIHGGFAPYTVTGLGAPVVTHQTTVSFHNLPPVVPGVGYHYVVIDSCGQADSMFHICVVPTPPIKSFFRNECPYDSTVILTNLDSICRPATITCLNCTPVQTVVVSATDSVPRSIFHSLLLDTVYRFRITDTCGFSFTQSYVLQLARVHVFGPTMISCNDYSIRAQILTPHVIFSLYSSAGLLLQSDTTGQFNNLAQDTYTIVASQPECLPDTSSIAVPSFGAECIVPSYSPTCQKVYDIFQGGPDLAENISLVNTVTGIVYNEIPPGPGNGMYFNDVPPGIYNLVSDSGCSVPVILPPHPTYTLSVVTYVNCSGLAEIKATASPSVSACVSDFKFLFGLFKADTLYAKNDSGHFTVVDTGLYTIKLLYSPLRNFNALPAWPDSICPVDTIQFTATRRSVPYIQTSEVDVCGATSKGSIPFTIVGGKAPYTLEIIGYPNLIVNSNSGTFPNVTAGLYTLIVYDDCGRSTSLSVLVNDTCSPNCTLHAQFYVPDTVVCKRSKLTFQNISVGARTFHWFINGADYGYARDTDYTPLSAGTYKVRLIAFRNVCADTITRTFIVQDSLGVNLGPDTTFCGPFTLLLNTHIKKTHWSGGNVDSTLIASSPGWYWAQVTNACGTYRDSMHIAIRSRPPFDLGRDTVLCIGQPIILHVAVDSATFLWSTGVTDSIDTITVQPNNPVWVNVYRNGCVTSDSVRVYFEFPLPPLYLGPSDTFYCDLTPFYLRVPYPLAVWSTGARDSIILVDSPGVYWATVTNSCNAVSDTLTISKQLSPHDFSLTATRPFICLTEPDSVLIEASISAGQSPTRFLWSTGTLDSAVIHSTTYIHSAGYVSVTADNGKCSLSKSINILLDSCGADCFERIALPDIFTPNGDNVNETFHILHQCPIDPFFMQIYNRWGELVFTSHDIDQGWDGTFKNVLQPEGVYLFSIGLGLRDRGIVKSITGTVLLAR